MNITSDTVFRALADPTRLRCLLLLAGEGELCVCEITHALDAPQPKISRHLALLRDAGLVRDRREGLWVYYRLNPALPDWVRQVIEVTAEGTQGTEGFDRDVATLHTMPNRPGKRCCAEH